VVLCLVSLEKRRTQKLPKTVLKSNGGVHSQSEPTKGHFNNNDNIAG
jgi:hypothetical protein